MEAAGAEEQRQLLRSLEARGVVNLRSTPATSPRERSLRTQHARLQRSFFNELRIGESRRRATSSLRHQLSETQQKARTAQAQLLRSLAHRPSTEGTFRRQREEYHTPRPPSVPVPHSAPARRPQVSPGSPADDGGWTRGSLERAAGLLDGEEGSEETQSGMVVTVAERANLNANSGELRMRLRKACAMRAAEAERHERDEEGFAKQARRMKQQIDGLRAEVRRLEAKARLTQARSLAGGENVAPRSVSRDPWVIRDTSWNLPDLLGEEEVAAAQGASQLGAALEELVSTELTGVMPHMPFEVRDQWYGQMQTATRGLCSINAAMRRLLAAFRSISSAEGMEEVIATIEHEARTLVDGSRCTVLMLDPESNDLWHASTRGTSSQRIALPSRPKQDSRTPIDRASGYPQWVLGCGFAPYAAATRRALCVPYGDLTAHVLYNDSVDGVPDAAGTTVLCVPIWEARRTSASEANAMPHGWPSQVSGFGASSSRPPATTQRRLLAIMRIEGKTLCYELPAARRSGKLSCGAAGGRDFTRADLHVATLLSAHCGAVLQRTLRGEEMARHHKRECTLLKLAHAIFTERDIRRLSHAIMEDSKHLIEADRCTLFLVAMHEDGAHANPAQPSASGVDAVHRVSSTRSLEAQSVAKSKDFYAFRRQSMLRARRNSELPGATATSGRVLWAMESDVLMRSRLPGSAPDDAAASPNVKLALGDGSPQLERRDSVTVFTPETTDIVIPFDGEGGGGQGVAGYVASTLETVNIPDAYLDPRFDQDVDRRTGYRTHSILCMPIKNSQGRLVAVVEMINKQSNTGSDVFDAEDEQLLSSVCTLIAVALENSRLFERTQRICEHVASFTGYARWEDAIPDIVETVKELLAVEGAALYVHPTETEEEQALRGSKPERFITYVEAGEEVESNDEDARRASLSSLISSAPGPCAKLVELSHHIVASGNIGKAASTRDVILTDFCDDVDGKAPTRLQPHHVGVFDLPGELPVSGGRVKQSLLVPVILDADPALPFSSPRVGAVMELVNRSSGEQFTHEDVVFAKIIAKQLGAVCRTIERAQGQSALQAREIFRHIVGDGLSRGACVVTLDATGRMIKTSQPINGFPPPPPDPNDFEAIVANACYVHDDRGNRLLCHLTSKSTEFQCAKPYTEWLRTRNTPFFAMRGHIDDALSRRVAVHVPRCAMSGGNAASTSLQHLGKSADRVTTEILAKIARRAWRHLNREGTPDLSLIHEVFEEAAQSVANRTQDDDFKPPSTLASHLMGGHSQATSGGRHLHRTSSLRVSPGGGGKAAKAHALAENEGDDALLPEALGNALSKLGWLKPSGEEFEALCDAFPSHVHPGRVSWRDLVHAVAGGMWVPAEVCEYWVVPSVRGATVVLLPKR